MAAVSRARLSSGRRTPRCGALAAVLCVALGAVVPGSVRAQGSDGEPASAASDASVLRVGIKEAPPFAIRNADGSWSGIAVDLWTAVAGSLERPFRFEERDLDDLLASLETGEIDAGVGALTVTAEREIRLDFSHPFYSSGLGIAVAPEGTTDWAGPLRGLFSVAFLRALAALALVLLLTGVAMWWLERRRNPEEFGGEAWRGIGEGVWWSAVTMTTVGYGDRAPRTLPGRIVALIWMFASVITISGFTAAIASTLTVGRLESSIRGPEDLRRVAVGSVSGTTAERYLERRGLSRVAYSSLGDALLALDDGSVKAVVHDAPILRYRARTDFAGRATVLAPVFAPQEYAIAVPPESPLREWISRAVLETTGQDRWASILVQYLGSE